MTFSSPTQRLEAWEDARGLWLSRQGSPNTALAYKQSLIKLLDHAKKQPGEISRRDINAWAASLQKHGLSNATIGIRLTAVSILGKGACMRKKEEIVTGSKSVNLIVGAGDLAVFKGPGTSHQVVKHLQHGAAVKIWEEKDGGARS